MALGLAIAPAATTILTNINIDNVGPGHGQCVAANARFAAVTEIREYSTQR